MMNSLCGTCHVDDGDNPLLDFSRGEPGLPGVGCMGCHGVPSYNNVYPTYKVPKLGGQHAQYLAAALQAYKDGQRSHKTMQAQAQAKAQAEQQAAARYAASR